jgi:hypothetical protein
MPPRWVVLMSAGMSDVAFEAKLRDEAPFARSKEEREKQITWIMRSLKGQYRF